MNHPCPLPQNTSKWLLLGFTICHHLPCDMAIYGEYAPHLPILQEQAPWKRLGRKWRGGAASQDQLQGLPENHFHHPESFDKLR